MWRDHGKEEWNFAIYKDRGKMEFELDHGQYFYTPRIGKAYLAETVAEPKPRVPAHVYLELLGLVREWLRAWMSDDAATLFCRSKCFRLYHQMSTSLLP